MMTTLVEHHEEHKRIIVVGACALDRLLHVQEYPKEDAKILCQASFEFGGGNAANTASGLGRMSTAKVLNSVHGEDNNSALTVQLLTKVADDDVKKQICDELLNFSVNISSELFVNGPKGSKSPVATVIVTNDESHSRTCFFDKGTCGVLEQSDVESIDLNNVFFRDVLLLHSDSRHTEAAAVLAKEARKRSIPVSLDVEKDRFTSAFDNLIDLATIIFTSGDQLKHIIKRRIGATGVTFFNEAKFDVSILHPNICSVQNEYGTLADTVSILYELMVLRHEFMSNGITLIVTRGHHGSIQSIVRNYCFTTKLAQPAIETYNKLKIIEVNRNNGKIVLTQSVQSVVKDQPLTIKVEEIEYEIHCVGPPHVDDVVDSTGAGDAFAAGYLWSEALLSQTKVYSLDFDESLFKLRMGSWCAGKKLTGPGARANLPTSEVINNELGLDIHTIFKSLEHKVSRSSFLH